MAEFELLQPDTVVEALNMSEKYRESMLLAGGTDILIAMDNHKITPVYLISLNKIGELHNYFQDEKGDMHMGAAVTINKIAEDPYIKRHYTALSHAAAKLGSWQIRNLATIGGNLCNGAPSAETATPLLAFNAQAVISTISGERTVPLSDFWLGPGSTVLDRHSLLKEIIIPAVGKNHRSVYLRHVIRRSIDIALVSMAAACKTDEDGKILRFSLALGAVAPTPILIKKAEDLVIGKTLFEIDDKEIAHIAAGEAKPISDIRASAWYRREMIEVLVKRGLERLSCTGRDDYETSH